MRVGYSSYFGRPFNFSIGDNFYSGPMGYFTTSPNAKVIIGNDVMFGPFVKLIGGNHNTNWPEGTMNRAPHDYENDNGIVIESDVWVGSGATIIDGAHVCEGAVVASMAVVTSNIPPYTIAMGVPTKKLKRRFDDETLKRVLAAKGQASKYTLEEILKIYKQVGLL